MLPATSLLLTDTIPPLWAVSTCKLIIVGTQASKVTRPASTDLEIERAARAVGAHDLVASLADGYLTPVAEAGRSLSAGQKQLLCLARALLKETNQAWASRAPLLVFVFARKRHPETLARFPCPHPLDRFAHSRHLSKATTERVLFR